MNNYERSARRIADYQEFLAWARANDLDMEARPLQFHWAAIAWMAARGHENV